MESETEEIIEWCGFTFHGRKHFVESLKTVLDFVGEMCGCEENKEEEDGN